MEIIVYCREKIKSCFIIWEGLVTRRLVAYPGDSCIIWKTHLTLYKKEMSTLILGLCMYLKSNSQADWYKVVIQNDECQE